MSLSHREVKPYVRMPGHWRKWRHDLSEHRSSQISNVRKHNVSGTGTVVRLTSVPETHVRGDSGDIIFGDSDASGHAGDTYRLIGSHTHSINRDGDRIHVPAKKNGVPSNNDGLKRARDRARKFRGIRNWMRK